MFIFNCADPNVWSAFLAAWGIESEIEIPPPPQALLDRLDQTHPDYEFHLADYAWRYIREHAGPIARFVRGLCRDAQSLPVPTGELN